MNKLSIGIGVLGVGVILTLIGVFVTVYNSPKIAFKRIFHFALPSSAVVEKYTNTTGKDGGLYYKISFNENDYETIVNGLGASMGQIRKEETPPGIVNICSWWDMNKQDVIVGYKSFFTKRDMFFGITQGEIEAFVVKTEDGKYYLYVAK